MSRPDMESSSQLRYIMLLPLELFQSLVSDMVVAVGLHGTTALRLVNKSFDEAVMLAIFRSGQFKPRVKWKRTRDFDKQLPGHLYTRYIIWRLKSQRGLNSCLNVSLNASIEFYEARIRSASRAWWHTKKQLMEVLLRSTADHVTFDNLKLRPQRGPINMTRVRQGALILAISIGDINTVATMLNEGADPNAGTVHLPCPLVTACRVGIMDITKLLIKTGAEINGGTIGSSLKGFRRSPLQSACEEGRTDIVHLLMNQAYDLTEDYAFKFAVASCINAGQTELFHFLSSKMGGSTSETLLYLGAVNGNVEIVNMLLERMHVGPHRLFETRLCLDLAAKNGRVTLVKALLDRGVQRYKTLSLTLLLAVLERRLEVARVLVDDGGALINSRHHFRGPEPNFGHVFTGTALMAAARNGDCPMIQMLMDRGVDLKMHRQGARALVLAKRRGHIDAVRFLTESN